MGGVFSFLGGLLSLGASAGLGIKEDMKQEAKNREYLSHNYAPYIQSFYDDEDWKLWQKYNYEKVAARVHSNYPGLSDTQEFRIVKAAVGKTLMEKETEYEYKIPDDIEDRFGDVSRFVDDSMKMPESLYDYYIDD